MLTYCGGLGETRQGVDRRVSGGDRGRGLGAGRGTMVAAWPHSHGLSRNVTSSLSRPRRVLGRTNTYGSRDTLGRGPRRGAGQGWWPLAWRVAAS